MRAKLCVVSMPADDPEALSAFYAQTLSLDLWGRNLTSQEHSRSTWISAGVKWNIGSKHHPNEGTMLHFQVDNLNQVCSAMQSKGGKVVFGPASIPIADAAFDRFAENYEKLKLGPKASVTRNMGTFAVAADPSGNRVSLIQLEAWAVKLFEGGEITQFEKAESSLGMANMQNFEKLEKAAGR